MTEIAQKVQLGKSDIQIPPMGIGTWAWGDRFFWAYGSTHSEDDVLEAFEVCIDAGLNFFDTASVYGFGHNESVFGELIKSTERSVIVASKLFPLPWRVSENIILRGIEGSVKRLDRNPIDLYTQHWPIPPLSIESWMRGLAMAKQEGIIREIGGSNLNLGFMKRACNELEKQGLQLVSNQVHFSLLHRTPEANGILAACRENGITMFAYSPLGQGLLTGKYEPGGSSPKGMMRLGGKQLIERIQPLIETLRRIGKNHGDKTPAQVAINWVICKGAVPLVGAKNARQAKENIGALGWKLSEEEVSTLDKASEIVQKSFPLENLVGLN